MEEIAPFDFDAAMSAADNAAAPAAGAADQAIASQSDLTPVRCFTKAGIEQVEELLKAIRSDKTLHKEDVEALLEDPMYAKELAGDFKVDRTRVFATKLELCDYFIPLFGKDFLEQNRKNAGLWTWLALAYYSQFVKTRKGAVALTSNARWIYDCDDFQNGRRHYLAGTINLYMQMINMEEGVIGMFFGGPALEFPKISDVLTRTRIGVQSPAVLRVAGWLYYDKKTKSHTKSGSATEGRRGSVFELARVVSQLACTWDLYDAASSKLLWDKLPSQFDDFKSNSDLAPIA